MTSGINGGKKWLETCFVCAVHPLMLLALIRAGEKKYCTIQDLTNQSFRPATVHPLGQIIFHCNKSVLLITHWHILPFCCDLLRCHAVVLARSSSLEAVPKKKSRQRAKDWSSVLPVVELFSDTDFDSLSRRKSY